ncbi:hypothetical protein KQ939_15165 [Planococcus sp. CP5-4]|uniref:hypothetical protein n=1 Tax=unclassified Planococcus (in: firmicutes) TaxID=2662419 RepID=UPI001C24CC2A|nr:MULTISPECIES: hypothetical protein [unclassified Planococcus (in: firmicutes)]MBU9674324.1 hypothetical protein [Planococcus sp. CP5-4_YE]MBV0909089.1 hypothetical protein [Planococcus sp. CP5-4_UN]MBW6065015.1 hypothetical protein [Planococcus sp. CP5-4]
MEAEAYLERQGYTPISMVEEDSLFFTKQDLTDPAYAPIWQVQPFDSTQYIDKELASVELIVQNHPLELLYNSKQTRTIVYLHQNKVIGGWSFPVSSSEALVGNVYSLDGKTVEEVEQEELSPN